MSKPTVDLDISRTYVYENEFYRLTGNYARQVTLGDAQPEQSPITLPGSPGHPSRVYSKFPHPDIESAIDTGIEYDIMCDLKVELVKINTTQVMSVSLSPETIWRNFRELYIVENVIEEND